MRKIKLSRGLSYAMKGFLCVKGIPFDVEDDLAKKLLETGRFEEVSVEEPGRKEEKEEFSADDIARMKKDQLVTFAVEHGIDINDCKNNDERIERIQGILGMASFVQMDLED